jgi:hypothetical protein
MADTGARNELSLYGLQEDRAGFTEHLPENYMYGQHSGD